MDKPSHYIEIRVLPLDGDTLSGGDVALVTTKIMAAIHLHIVEGNDVAVSFPKLREKPAKNPDGLGVEPIGTGSVIRVFGSAMSLMGLVVRQDFAFLIGAAACSVGKQAIREVPEHTYWEVYERNRSSERNTDAYVLRSSQRLLSRIAAGKSNMAEQDVAERAQSIGTRTEGRLPPYIQIASSSTGKKFRLFIKRNAANGFREGRPSKYGLGVTVPSF